MKTNEIMINKVKIVDFYIANKNIVINHIKSSNTMIKMLKSIKIMQIGQHTLPKQRQKLALLIHEFTIPEYTN